MSNDASIQFKLNIPADLKRRLEHEAIEARRSLSAEIIARLEESLAHKDTNLFVAHSLSDEQLADWFKRINQQLSRLEANTVRDNQKTENDSPD